MKSRTFLALLTFSVCLSLTAQTELTIDASRRGPQINPSLYGLFFEEINHAGDGGLYAELIRNRSFEDNQKEPEIWKAEGQANLTLIKEGLLNKAQHHAVQIDLPTSTSVKHLAGLSNPGYWGINAVKGQKYNLSLWLKAPEGYLGHIYALLQSEDGQKTYGRAVLKGIGRNWKKFSATLLCSTSDPKARFALLFDRAGKVQLDVVSLFPPTFKDRKNGLRPDLAQMLADTKPSFIRFPGGCFVEGVGSPDNSFRWKKTIGPIEEREGHWNGNWGYRCTDGLGFDEYLQMCEDMNAAPLFVINVGLGHGYVIPLNEMQPFVQDALDALEYANGSITTTFGKLRASNGHPTPYNIKYVEIGNENYQQNPKEQSQEYAERYEMFRRAIKAKYPDITLIGNVESWGTETPTWRNNYPVEIVDEHYYRSHRWMRNNFTKYDNFPRGSYNVYNGEYAANAGGTYGKNGTIQSALGEAIYMLGMERNADVCVMASFAPIFTNENDRRWDYDMIHHTSSACFGTPSYYVQQLMSHHLGHQNLIIEEANNMGTPKIDNSFVGLGTWHTTAQFSDFAILDADNRFLGKEGYAANLNHWTPKSGKWEERKQAYCQDAENENGMTVYNQVNLKGQDYEINVKARKQSGQEGFLIVFNYQDDNNFCWWNIGGWNNTASALEICEDGTKTTVGRTDFKVQAGKTYDLRLVIRGTNVKGYVDDMEILNVQIPEQRLIYSTAALNETGNELLIKIVNPEGLKNNVKLSLKGLQPTTGSVIQLKGENAKAENTIENPKHVVPSPETPLPNVSSAMTFTAPPYSLNILKLRLK